MSEEEDVWPESSNAKALADNTIFVQDGAPVPMYLHNSLGRGGKQAIAEKIKAAGGDPTCEEDRAEVIICRDDQPRFKKLQLKYDHHRYVWVEPPSWVDTCLIRRKYEHILPSRGSTRGGRGGAGTPFTEEDDRCLAKFLALRIPYKDSGGRNGHAVYKDLCARDNQYPWAKRHPWQSWRERYAKNQDLFDPRIARIVKNDPDKPVPGGKGQYVIPNRQRRKLVRYTVQSDSDESMEEVVMQNDEAEEEELNDDEEWVSYKRPRQEDALDRRHTEGRSSASPPRKQARRHRKQVVEDDDSDLGTGHDNYNEEPRPESPELEYNIVQPDDAFNPRLGGPSQFDYSPEQAKGISVAPVTTSTLDNAKARHGPAVLSSKLSKAPSNKGNMAPPPPRKSVAHDSGPPVASSSRRPADSQKTVAGPSQAQLNPLSGPADTQATLVPSSPPKLYPEPPSPVQRPQASPPRVYANTRSRARSASAEPVFAAPSHIARNKRGRKKAQQSGAPSEALLPAVREESQEVGSTHVSGGASLPEEAHVEELLQPDDDNSLEDGSSGSSEDDQEAKRLLAAQMVLLGANLPGQPLAQDPPAPGSTKSLRHVNFDEIAQTGSRSRKATGLQVSRLPRENDPDATPKPKPFLKAAKKVATRGVPPVITGDEDIDNQSETTKTTTSTSSFPAEDTDARQYKTAQSPFTPAQGTRAEKHVRITRSTKGKGKARPR